MTDAELAELAAVLQECTARAENTQQQATALLERLQNNELPTGDGVSFLEAKNHLLLNYNIHLAFFMLLKLHGIDTGSHPCRDQLVYLRVLMDKIKPVDARLKYQIEKMVKSSVAGAAATADEDPLMHRPKPEALVAKVGDGAAAGAENDEESGVYEPPKLSATPYFEDDSKAAKAERRREREQRRMQQSSMMRELRDEYSDMPSEVRHSDEFQTVGAPTKDDHEIREYEESHFVRLSGKQRKRPKVQTHMGTMNDLLDFGSARHLAHEERQAKRQRTTMRMSDRMSEIQRPEVPSKSLRGGKFGKKRH